MAGLFSKETRRAIAIQPGELRIVRWAAAYFFFVLASFSILRPLRETFGVSTGLDKLPFLFMGTWVVMLLLNPLYGAVVSKLPRRRFIPLVYRFFMLPLAAFFVAMVAGGPVPVWVKYSYYVFVSVFNLWVVSVFWSFMADNFGSASARRLYAWIAVGGTLGAIFSALVALGITLLEAHQAMPALLVLAIVFLEAAVRCNAKVISLFEEHPELATSPDHGTGALGGASLDGLIRVLRSPYLLRICLYLFCYTVTGTLLYFMQAGVVSWQFESTTDRIWGFALIDLATQTATLLVQVFVTRRLIAAFGLGPALAVLPVVAGLAIISISVWPLFSVVVVAQGLRRAARYAVTKPSREVLFSVVDRTEKYKAKAVIDTFVYRTGDVIGGGVQLATIRAGQAAALAAPIVAVAITVFWTFLAGSLGRAYRERAPSDEGSPA